MKAVLVLGGEPPDPQRLKALASAFPVYAADGGAAACLRAGVRPEWVAGDFDSQDPEALPADWRLLEFPEQDRTDFQKLLGSLPPEIHSLRILGGLGGRLDHLLTNLLVAAEADGELEVIFENQGQEIHRVTSARPFRGDPPAGSTISLIPLGKAAGVRSSGLNWNLRDTDMGAGLQLGQSNLVKGPVEIRLRSGVLFVWMAVPGGTL